MEKHKCKYCGAMTTCNDENCLEKPAHIKPVTKFDWIRYIHQIITNTQFPFYYDN